MRKIIAAILCGIPIGITVGFIISLFFSVIYRSQSYLPSTPTFIAQFSSPLIATIVSSVLWALIGIVFSLTNLLFQVDSWSITRQTVGHFVLSYLGFTPLAILCGWFPKSIAWLALFSLIYLVIYIIVWFISMSIAQAEVRRLNRMFKQS
ncbi:DUF3021 domain-containing protein [Furfurilactobacillus curtus]|uniref:DUF3021 domain-containing protein n=1 Tax=Furfurilactobacillus curtus TaxID=1746200 RepID=UPI0038B27362